MKHQLFQSICLKYGLQVLRYYKIIIDLNIIFCKVMKHQHFQSICL